jgi:hypothetical protein
MACPPHVTKGWRVWSYLPVKENSIEYSIILGIMGVNI